VHKMVHEVCEKNDIMLNGVTQKLIIRILAPLSLSSTSGGSCISYEGQFWRFHG